VFPDKSDLTEVFPVFLKFLEANKNQVISIKSTSFQSLKSETFGFNFFKIFAKIFSFSKILISSVQASRHHHKFERAPQMQKSRLLTSIETQKKGQNPAFL
jgi:hypothetical protein